MNQKITKIRMAFPKILQVYAILFFAIDIALAVFSLAGVWSDASVPLVSRLSNLICQGSFINGIISSLALLFGQYILAIKGAYRMSEVAARFTLDSMAQKNFQVDFMLNAGKISQDQAREQREDIRKEAEYYSALDGSAGFLAKTTKANTILCAIIFAVAVAIEILLQGKTRLQAVEGAVFLVAGNVPLFVLPVAIASLFVSVASNRSIAS